MGHTLVGFSRQCKRGGRTSLWTTSRVRRKKKIFMFTVPPLAPCSSTLIPHHTLLRLVLQLFHSRTNIKPQRWASVSCALWSPGAPGTVNLVCLHFAVFTWPLCRAEYLVVQAETWVTTWSCCTHSFHLKIRQKHNTHKYTQSIFHQIYCDTFVISSRTDWAQRTVTLFSWNYKYLLWKPAVIFIPAEAKFTDQASPARPATEQPSSPDSPLREQRGHRASESGWFHSEKQVRLEPSGHFLQKLSHGNQKLTLNEVKRNLRRF